MTHSPEAMLKGLALPSSVEAMGLHRRNKLTSRLLDSFIDRTLDGAMQTEIPLEKHIGDKHPDLPHELTQFLEAFQSQSVSMRYRLLIARHNPKLSLVVSRGMEDAASIDIWNKMEEIRVTITNHWPDVTEIDDAHKKLESMLQQGDGYQQRVNHLSMGQQVMLLAMQTP